MVAAFGPPTVYLFSETEHLPRFTDRLRLLPVLTLIGFGLSLNNTVAFVEGFFGKGIGNFTRTPKYNLTGRKGSWTGSIYADPVSPLLWSELALGFYALLTSLILGFLLGWQALPWLSVYAVGYFYIAGLNLAQIGQGTRHRPGLAASVKSGD